MDSMQCFFNLTCYKYFSIGGTNTPIMFTHNLGHSSAVGKFQDRRKGGMWQTGKVPIHYITLQEHILLFPVMLAFHLCQ